MIRTTVLLFTLSYTLTINADTVPLFPDVDGWKLNNEVKSYDSESLWEYINGAADYYLNFGFEGLRVAEYSQSEDIYIKAEIYFHNTHLNAFGIYAYEKPEKGNFLEIGAEGYIAHSALNLYLGNYYIKIHSHNSSDETIETIQLLGKTIAGKLNTSNTAPFELKILPDKNRTSHTEKYIPNNYMGYSFFSNVIKAKYEIEDNKFEMFCITNQTDEIAQNTLTEYLEFNKQKTVIEANRVYEINDLFNNKVFIAIQGSKIFGVWNSTDENTAKIFLEEFLNK